MKTWMLLQVSSILMLISGCSGLGDITFDPKELNNLRTEPEIRALHYNPWLSLGVSTFHWIGGPTIDRLEIDDPIWETQDRFITSLTKELGLNNVRTIREARGIPDHHPFSGAPLFPLKRTFVKGLVFDFDSLYWGLGSMPHTHYRYHLEYAVRGRLVRVDDSNILWQARCFVQLQASSGTELAELTANENLLLKSKRDEAAARCGDQLLEKFFGK